MDKTIAEAIIKQEFPRYQKLFHLQDWTITFKYRWIDDEDDLTFGNCVAEPGYKTATIAINHDLLDNKEELLKVMRHEMIHILHSSFDIYRDAIEKLLGKSEFEALDTVYSYCSEEAVMFIENILDKELKLPLEKESKNGRKK